MDRYVPGCTSYVRPVIDAHGSPPETSCPVPAPTLDSVLWGTLLERARVGCTARDNGTHHLPLSSREGSTSAMLLGVAGACESFRLLQRVQQSRVYGDGARWRTFALMTCLAFGTVALMGYLASEASSRSERPPEYK
jgi:hypothetical protein